MAASATMATTGVMTRSARKTGRRPWSHHHRYIASAAMLIVLRREAAATKRAKKGPKLDKGDIAAEVQKHVNDYLATVDQAKAVQVAPVKGREATYKMHLTEHTEKCTDFWHFVLNNKLSTGGAIMRAISNAATCKGYKLRSAEEWAPHHPADKRSMARIAACTDTTELARLMNSLTLAGPGARPATYSFD